MASSLAQKGDGLHPTGRDEDKLKAVTEMSKSLTEATSIVDLGSFPKAGVAMIFGAGGGIGGALAEALSSSDSFGHVIGFSRKTSPSIDLMDEASLESWLGKFGQWDKWSFCLTAARMAAAQEIP